MGGWWGASSRVLLVVALFGSTLSAVPVARAAKAKPDLAVRSLAADQPSSTQIRLTALVRNIGKSRSTETTLGLVLSTDPTLDGTDDRLVDKPRIKALEPGRKATVTTTIAAPESDSFRYLFACVDPAKKVSEKNETNNCFSALVHHDPADLGNTLGALLATPEKQVVREAAMDPADHDVFEELLQSITGSMWERYASSLSSFDLAKPPAERRLTSLRHAAPRDSEADLTNSKNRIESSGDTPAWAEESSFVRGKRQDDVITVDVQTSAEVNNNSGQLVVSKLLLSHTSMNYCPDSTGGFDGTFQQTVKESLDWNVSGMVGHEETVMALTGTITGRASDKGKLASLTVQVQGTLDDQWVGAPPPGSAELPQNTHAEMSLSMTGKSERDLKIDMATVTSSGSDEKTEGRLLKVGIGMPYVFSTLGPGSAVNEGNTAMGKGFCIQVDTDAPSDLSLKPQEKRTFVVGIEHLDEPGAVEGTADAQSARPFPKLVVNPSFEEIPAPGSFTVTAPARRSEAWQDFKEKGESVIFGVFSKRGSDLLMIDFVAEDTGPPRAEADITFSYTDSFSGGSDERHDGQETRSGTLHLVLVETQDEGLYEDFGTSSFTVTGSREETVSEASQCNGRYTARDDGVGTFASNDVYFNAEIMGEEFWVHPPILVWTRTTTTPEFCGGNSSFEARGAAPPCPYGNFAWEFIRSASDGGKYAFDCTSTRSYTDAAGTEHNLTSTVSGTLTLHP